MSRVRLSYGHTFYSKMLALFKSFLLLIWFFPKIQRSTSALSSIRGAYQVHLKVSWTVCLSLYKLWSASTAWAPGLSKSLKMCDQQVSSCEDQQNFHNSSTTPTGWHSPCLTATGRLLLTPRVCCWLACTWSPVSTNVTLPSSTVIWSWQSLNWIHRLQKCLR